jgi:hypothetical protein
MRKKAAPPIPKSMRSPTPYIQYFFHEGGFILFHVFPIAIGCETMVGVTTFHTTGSGFTPGMAHSDMTNGASGTSVTSLGITVGGASAGNGGGASTGISGTTFTEAAETSYDVICGASVIPTGEGSMVGTEGVSLIGASGTSFTGADGATFCGSRGVFSMGEELDYFFKIT